MSNVCVLRVMFDFSSTPNRTGVKLAKPIHAFIYYNQNVFASMKFVAEYHIQQKSIMFSYHIKTNIEKIAAAPELNLDCYVRMCNLLSATSSGAE